MRIRLGDQCKGVDEHLVVLHVVEPADVADDDRLRGQRPECAHRSPADDVACEPPLIDSVRGYVVRAGGRVLEPSPEGVVVELTASEAEINQFVSDLGERTDIVAAHDPTRVLYRVDELGAFAAGDLDDAPPPSDDMTFVYVADGIEVSERHLLIARSERNVGARKRNAYDCSCAGAPAPHPALLAMFVALLIARARRAVPRTSC